MKIGINRKTVSIFLVLFSSLFILSINYSYGADEENCILCHRHENLRVIDDSGNIRSFYVDNEHYQKSLHKRARCRGCHTRITEVPHKKSPKKVSCGIRCHLSKTLAVGGFSHSVEYDAFMTSAHGTKSEDAPDCLYCHPKNEEKRKKKKDRLEILAACAGCHRDDDIMAKYGIAPGVVESYKRSAHGRIFFLQQKAGIICTDCHSIHNIAKKEMEASPLNEKNRMKTCAGQETSIKGCHLVSNPDFIFAFDHEINKEAGISAGLSLNNFINFLMLFVFYVFCVMNIFRIIRE